MFWWAIEKHCEVGREAVLAMMEDARVWGQAMVGREILPRLMRRFATTGREADLLVCAHLLRRAPGEAERARLMEGFEQAFAGGALPTLPRELLAAMGEGSGLSLVLRVRRGDEDATREAIVLAADPETAQADRLQLIRTLGEVAAPPAREVLLRLVREPDAPAVRLAALGALQAFAGPEIGAAVVAL
jgi:hypothetical protein